MTEPRIVDALVLAAGTPRPGDPLHPLTRGGPKALLPIAGRPMLEWVLAAVDRACTIRGMIVVGAPAGAVAATGAKPRRFVADHGDLVANVLAGGAAARAADSPATHVLVVSSDIPALTPEAVDWHVATTVHLPHEAYGFLIERTVMEARFPDAGRTYVRFRDGRFAFGDMSLFTLSLVRDPHPAWRQLVEARKRPLSLARIVGLDTVVLFALGWLSVAGCLGRLRRRLGVDVAALPCPYAEAAMDVDTPAQHALLDGILR